VQIAASLHPVSNPVVDRRGNIYTTVSGSAGQKTQVAIYKIDTEYNARPLVTEMMNATGLAIDAEGALYSSSRHDGVVYQVSPAGQVELFYRGLGRPQGMAFDAKGNLYIAASLSGRRGVVRITLAGDAELFLSGPAIVGLAFTPGKAMILATNSALYKVDAGI